MGQFEKHYTLEEANGLLPEVRQQIAALQAARDQLVADWRQAGPALEAAHTNGGGHEAAGYVADLSELSQHLKWFSRRGIQVKDIDRGLIDFPALRDGEEVLLCWEAAEDRVAYWHDLESGYAGRQRW
jgi:hypothetical protein